jgi:hypothetical protein
VAHAIILDIDERFPSVDLLEALSIVHPRFWIDFDMGNPTHTAQLAAHVQFLSTRYGTVVEDVPCPLDGRKLLSQMVAFKYLMTDKQGICQQIISSSAVASEAASSSTASAQGSTSSSTFTTLWQRITASPLIADSISEFVHVAQIYAVMPVGSIDDERAFSSLTFLKNDTRNRLDAHLPSVMRMFCQDLFDVGTFPYDRVFADWMDGAATRGRYTIVDGLVAADK